MDNKNENWYCNRRFSSRWFSLDVTAAMLVHRIIEKIVFWEFDSIIMQNMSHDLLLFCALTWPSHHVIENPVFFRKQTHKHTTLLFHNNINSP